MSLPPLPSLAPALPRPCPSHPCPLTARLVKPPDLYTLPVSVGTPPQDIDVLLSMHVVDLWVYGTVCDNPPCRANGEYDSSASSSSRPSANKDDAPANFTLRPGNELISDTVRVGAHTADKVMGRLYGAQ